MRSFLSFKPGHDGTIAHIEEGQLRFSIEAEKDSYLRHDWIGPELFLNSLARLDDMPDVVCVSGWSKGDNDFTLTTGAGYFGATEESVVTRRMSMLGQEIVYFSSSHERSHIWSAYGLSPFPEGQRCYCLVWEGIIGRFYEVDEALKVTALPVVMSYPGYRYAFAYALADESFAESERYPRLSDAGKLMALAAFHDGSACSAEDAALIAALLDPAEAERELVKSRFTGSHMRNAGVQSQQFKNFAWHFSNAIFERFRQYAEAHLDHGLPLLISGGCGLNCDWNRAWEESGLFSEVFVPPCTNDTGSALGTGVDAMRHFTGRAKLGWSVYAGQEFEDDFETMETEGFHVSDYVPEQVAALLAEGKIIAHAAGRSEMGPRALGNRSILASPLLPGSLDRLNQIKRREAYRPVAPIVMEGYAPQVFSPGRPSPFMLFFDEVTTGDLPAITHVDKSARIQTVSPDQNSRVHALLAAFKAETGHGVLCNTSLNFLGRGFINTTSDLARYARDFGLDGFVAGARLFMRDGR